MLPSELSGVVHRGEGMFIWQEISSKRVHPETALPSSSLPNVKVNLARNEAESVQLAFNCDENTVIDSIDVSPLTNDAKETFETANVLLQFLEYQEDYQSYRLLNLYTR